MISMRRAPGVLQPLKSLHRPGSGRPGRINAEAAGTADQVIPDFAETGVNARCRVIGETIGLKMKPAAAGGCSSGIFAAIWAFLNAQGLETADAAMTNPDSCVMVTAFARYIFRELDIGGLDHDRVMATRGGSIARQRHGRGLCFALSN